MKAGKKQVDVLVNGSAVETLSFAGGRTVEGPRVIDVSRFMKPGVNRIALRGEDAIPVETQFNLVWFEKWAQARRAKEFALRTELSSTAVRVNEAVTYTVTASRPEFRGYGMMIAEIGLPPGAEVDRGSLEATLGDAQSGVDSYEVAPDHVTFYVWPRASDAVFHFAFRPRFAMDVRMASSVLYDYYNPEARAVLVPGEFRAR